MAAGTLPEPGTRYGPCEEPCNHRDCNQTRGMAESKCLDCEEPIGYNTRFFQETRDKKGRPKGLVHAKCFYGRE